MHGSIFMQEEYNMGLLRSKALKIYFYLTPIKFQTAPNLLVLN
jgi:hypothetical protein